MKITTAQLRQIIREEILKVRKSSINEAKEEKIKPIDPKKLQKVIMDVGVKQQIWMDKSEGSKELKALTNAPILVNKAIDGDERAYSKMMTGLESSGPEYNNADDSKTARWFEKFSDLRQSVSDTMYEGEPGDIAKDWNKLKAHIESHPFK